MAQTDARVVQAGGADVREAGSRLTGRVVRTPVLRSDDLDALAGARLWLKAENTQRSGSFKLRGALLAVEALVASGSRGVVAQSTGNHAIAVAVAARESRVPAVLVLPTDATPGKIHRIREAGADVVLAGTLLADRVAAVEELREARGLDVIDPYQNSHVVRGQGTATAELLEQASVAGARLGAVVLPVGGGSAIAGACLAAAGQDVAVIGAEPLAVPALTEALRAGGPVTVRGGPTIADGLRPDRIGQLPFDICRGAITAVETVEEPDIAEAMCLALLKARLLVEPAAATALAVALRLARRPRWRRRDIGVLLSGGNVDADMVSAVLAQYVERTNDHR